MTARSVRQPLDEQHLVAVEDPELRVVADRPRAGPPAPASPPRAATASATPASASSHSRDPDPHPPVRVAGEQPVLDQLGHQPRRRRQRQPGPAGHLRRPSAPSSSGVNASRMRTARSSTDSPSSTAPSCQCGHPWVSRQAGAGRVLGQRDAVVPHLVDAYRREPPALGGAAQAAVVPTGAVGVVGRPAAEQVRGEQVGAGRGAVAVEVDGVPLQHRRGFRGGGRGGHQRCPAFSGSVCPRRARKVTTAMTAAATPSTASAGCRPPTPGPSAAMTSGERNSPMNRVPVHRPVPRPRCSKLQSVDRPGQQRGQQHAGAEPGEDGADGDDDGRGRARRRARGRRRRGRTRRAAGRAARAGTAARTRWRRPRWPVT